MARVHSATRSVPASQPAQSGLRQSLELRTSRRRADHTASLDRRWLKY